MSMIGVAVTHIKPLGDRVLVRPVAREERSRGGILLPDTAKEKPQVGQVLAAGTGRVLDDGKRQPLEVKEGDTILFSKYAGTELKVDGQDVLIISDRDILAIVEG
jgi:chaperonin GroES